MLKLQKDLLKCFSYISFLIELSKGRKLSGYDIIVHVKKFGGEVSPGTVYHQVHRLERNGIIKGIQEVSGKTVYEITDEGLRAFKEFKVRCRASVNYVHQNFMNRQ